MLTKKLFLLALNSPLPPPHTHPPHILPFSTSSPPLFLHISMFPAPGEGESVPFPFPILWDKLQFFQLLKHKKNKKNYCSFFLQSIHAASCSLCSLCLPPYFLRVQDTMINCFIHPDFFLASKRICQPYLEKIRP